MNMRQGKTEKCTEGPRAVMNNHHSLAQFGSFCDVCLEPPKTCLQYTTWAGLSDVGVFPGHAHERETGDQGFCSGHGVLGITLFLPLCSENNLEISDDPKCSSY